MSRPSTLLFWRDLILRPIGFTLVFFTLCPFGCTCDQKGESRRRSKPPVVVIDPDEVDQPRPVAEKEPNDSPKQAQDLSRDTRVEGKMGFTEGVKGDRDWYRVKVGEEKQILKAALSGVTGLDLILEAWNSKRERLVRVNNSKEGEGEVLVNLAVDKGTYYLLVREAKGRFAEGSYSLSTSLRAQEEGEEREPNYKASLATPMTLDKESVGYLGWHTDTDWFRLELPVLTPAARLRVEYDGLDDVRANLSIRNAAGLILQERWGGPGEGIALPNMALAERGQPLYVVLRCKNHFNVESRYALRAVSAVPMGFAEAEPNDAPVNATPIVLGKSFSGILADTQDRDVFSVKLSQAAMIRVHVTPPLGLDVALAMLSDDGEVIWEVDEGGERGAEMLPVLWARPPRALFQVRAPRQQSVSSVSPYHLTVEMLGDTNWEHEPNNIMAKASPWSNDLIPMKGFIYPRNDVDFYRVSSRSEHLRLIVDAVPGLKLRLQLFDLSGTSVAISGPPVAQGEGTIRLEATVQAGREYVLQVSDTAGGANGRAEYHLRRENP